MKLVVGLGNVGRKYEGTRHNVGFEVMRQLRDRFGVGSVSEKFHGELCECLMAGQKVWLLCPATLMNRSGASALAARDFYKLEHEDMLVVCDDFHLPLGKIRLRNGGSAGGQKGLHDIIRRLGDNNVPRLRVGIGAPPPQWQVADYVLSRFTSEDRPIVDETVKRAAQAVECWAVEGITAAMNQFNATSAAPSAENSRQQNPGDKDIG